MRCLALTLICLAAAPTMGVAEGWKVMYLADSGGSRPMQVGPDEGGIPFAYVDNAKGERLTIGCRWTGNADLGYEWSLKIHPGQEPTFLPVEPEGNRIIVTFDDDPAGQDLGGFTFVQEAFWADVPASLAAEIKARGVIRLEMPGPYVEGGKAYRTDFTLSGSGAALRRSCPVL
ncbi:MAG: hypothetical protein EAZ40_00305 [Rhodobacterales bacterium]|nr:MAG: hypothetical protein EAZ40_00305 [Rhodobacterales bacterium]